MIQEFQSVVRSWLFAGEFFPETPEEHGGDHG
jgi:hypothetical protein